jgi:hypothetical protein
MIDGMIFRWLFLARKIPKIPPAHPENCISDCQRKGKNRTLA